MRLLRGTNGAMTGNGFAKAGKHRAFWAQATALLGVWCGGHIWSVWGEHVCKTLKGKAGWFGQREKRRMAQIFWGYILQQHGFCSARCGGHWRVLNSQWHDLTYNYKGPILTVVWRMD